MNVDEARDVVRDSVLHVKQDTFSNEKVDRAISAAGRKFIRRTNCNAEILDVLLGIGDGLVDLSEDEEDFVSDQVVTLWRDDDDVELRVMQFASLLRRGDQSGTPRFVAFPTETQAYFFPAADAEITIKLLRRKPLVSWIFGTASPGSVTLNLPYEWEYDVLWWGAKSYLIGGAPGHRDAEAALAMFEQLIAQASERFMRGRGPDEDAATHPSTKTHLRDHVPAGRAGGS